MSKLEGEALHAALHTIKDRHYTRSVPSGKRLVYTLEDAIVVFAIPANMNISLWLLGEPNAVWELSRLWAPDGHRPNLLTEAISASTRAFRREVPACRALISYADPNVGHRGGVYLAASWVSLGQCEESRYYRAPGGETISRRAFHSGRRSLTKAEIEAKGFVQHNLPGKLRFARGLTRSARRAIAIKAKQA